MAQIDKIYIQEEGLTYNIAQSPDATFSAISNDTDTASAKSWIEVDKLVSGETNGSIFNKMSKMFSNIRYLYNELGGSSGSGGSIITRIESLTKDKANIKHTHMDVADLPVINQQYEGDDKIPLSSVVWSMNETIKTLQTTAKTLSEKM